MAGHKKMGIERRKVKNYITVEEYLNWQWIQGGSGTMVAGIHVYILRNSSIYMAQLLAIPFSFHRFVFLLRVSFPHLMLSANKWTLQFQVTMTLHLQTPPSPF